VRSRRRRSLPRRAWRQALEPGVPVGRLEWTRREPEARHPTASRRAAAAAAALVELVLLVWLLAGSGFALRTFQIDGLHHLTAAQIRAATGLRGEPSVLGLDADTIRRKLEQLPWVRAASVTPVLPSTLRVSISEWRALAAYRVGDGVYLLNGQAVVLEEVPAAGGLPEIDGPASPAPRTGHAVMAPELLTALVNMTRAFPLATGQQVSRYELDACGDLKLVARSGFSVIFGRVLTPEQFQSLQTKVDALAALRGTVDYGSKNLDYVNVENPSAPAVHLKSSNPASPAPTPTPGSGGIQVIGCQ
jgi:cell division septal protein FtsQ